MPKMPIDAILDELIRCDDLHPDERENVREVLNRRHTHQYEQVFLFANGQLY